MTLGWKLKRRPSWLTHTLVLFLVLAAVGVIFAPIVYETNKAPFVDTRTQIPVPEAVPEIQFNEPTRPRGIDPAKDPETMFLPKSQSPADEEKETIRLSLKGLPKAWVVQVAEFNQDRHEEKLAHQLLRQLLDAGYTAYLRQVKDGNTAYIRAFVGPKLDKQRAWQIKRELDALLGLETLVLTFQP